MNKSTIYYHNPKCSKSMEGLEILKQNQIKVKIKLYLSEKISFIEIKNIIKKLEINAIDIVRLKEKIIKDENINFSNMSDTEIINTLVKYPILIERPIIVTGKKAIIGRPPELIKNFLHTQ
jgi:arsenate reductase